MLILKSTIDNMIRKLVLLQLLALTGGLLSALAWYPCCSGLVLLFSFVPVFLIAQTEIPEYGRFGERLMFIRLLPAFAIFNIVSIAWVRIVGVPLLVTAITANTFLMTFTFWLAWLVRRRAGAVVGNVAYITFWLTMEYLTNHVSWFSPWLNLGNSMAAEPDLIQWYEFTGVAGGTLWILITNLSITSIIKKAPRRSILQTSVATLALLLLLIALPLKISNTIAAGITEPDIPPEEVLIIQPCIDPYSEKFSIPVTDQISKVLSLAGSRVTKKTRWIIAPETIIPVAVPIDSLNTNTHIATIASFLQQYPNAIFIAGAVTSSNPPANQLHNSALLISSGGTQGIYHKSKLVPGIEGSFKGIISVLQFLFPDLGNSSGGYTGIKDQPLMASSQGSTPIAPIICFESAFGGYVARFVRKGAQIVTIITNDGWWKGTLGYYQHLNFSRLRAIETRRPVIRAANTGISAIINSRGEITNLTEWWEEATILATVSPSDTITFYTRNGDLIMRIASSITIFILIIHLVAIPLRKKINLKKKSSGMQP
jgi:apolipoprotein N-acyltransferase